MKELKWTGDNHREMWMHLTGLSINDSMTTYSDTFTINFTKGYGGLVIKTPDGEMFCPIGNAVVKDEDVYWVM